MEADTGLFKIGRIFGFASHAQSACFHVRKDILHDLPKVCRTQWIVAKIVAVAPATDEEEEVVEEKKKEEKRSDSEQSQGKCRAPVCKG